MLIYSVVIVLSSFMPCFITSLPPQSTTESDNDSTNDGNRNIGSNWSYRYKYTIDDSNGNGKEEARFGESGGGRYNVNGEQSSTDVKYFPDEWGYHPLAKYIPSAEYATANIHFPVDAHKSHAAVNNSKINKNEILIESQDNSTNEEFLPVNNDWTNNTQGINLNDNNDDDNNNNNRIAYQHQWVNYPGNQYQTEAAVNFPLAHKQGNLKTSTDYSTEPNDRDNPHAIDIMTPSVPAVDEALLLFENFGDKIIKTDNSGSKKLNYFDNDTGAVETQNYYVSSESPAENNGDKPIRVSSENYKNALASFKSQLFKNSQSSLNNRKGFTAAAATTTTTTTNRKVLPELSRLTFQSFNDSFSEIISEKEETGATVNPQTTKFNSREPIVVSETGIITTQNYEYGTTKFPCNIEKENKEVVKSELLSLTTIPQEEPKSSTDEGTVLYNTAVHSVHSPLFIRELFNGDQDTTSPVILNPIQAGLALVNANKTHLIGRKVEPSLTELKSTIEPLNQFKLNGYSSLDINQSDKEIYRSDNYPLENISTTSENQNDQSIKLPTTENVTLASISHDNDNDKFVEIQKSVELYHSAPVHEIHYPAQLTINHPPPPASSGSPNLVYLTLHQDNDQQKDHISNTDTDLSNSNTDLSFKFLSIVDQTSPVTTTKEQEQPIDPNSNNIVVEIEKQKIVEINNDSRNNFTNQNNVLADTEEEDKKLSQDQTLSPSEFFGGQVLLLNRELDKNNQKEFYPSTEDEKISDGTDNSEQTVYIYSPPGVSDGGYGSIEPQNYNINLRTNTETVKSSNYPVGKLVEGVLDITGGSSGPYIVNKDRVVEKHQKLKPKQRQKLKQKHVPVIQAYPVTVQKMSKNKVPSSHQPTKTITGAGASTSNTGTSIHKLLSQPYPVHILEQFPYQVDKVIEMPIRIPTYHPLGGIPPRLPPPLSSSSIKSNKLKNNQGIQYGFTYHQQIINPYTNGMYPARLQETNSGEVESLANSSTQNFKGYVIGKQGVMPLVVAMRSPLSKRYSLLSQFGLVKPQQQHHQHIINYYPSLNSKKQFHNNNNNNFMNQLPISMHHPKSVVDQTSFQWDVIHPSEKQKITKIEYVGSVPSLTPHHVLNLHQNQVPHPAHQESLHYLDATDTSSSSSSSSSSSALAAPSFFRRVKLPEIHYYGKIGNFRQSKMEYGFKPPMVPSIQYDEETGTKVDNH